MIKAVVRPWLIVLAFILITTVFSFVLSSVTTKNASAGAPTCTWTGGGGSGNTNFSTSTNWSCETGTVPVDGTTIIFPVNLANRTGVNNLSSSVTFSGIEFSGTCSGGFGASNYTLTGTFYLSGNIVDTTTSNCLVNTTIATVSLRGDSGYDIGASSGITINNLATSTYAFAIDGTANPTYASFNLLNGLSTSLTGSGVISITSATVNLFAGTTVSSFSGSFTLNSARLSASKADTSTSTWALGTASIAIGTGSSFSVGLPTALNTFSIANPIQVSGTAPAVSPGGPNGSESARIGIQFLSSEEGDIFGLLGVYAGYRSQALSGKSMTFTGAVTLSTNLTVLSNGQTTFSGALSGGSRTITSYVTTSPANGKYGTLVVAGSSNTTATANASYAQTALRTTTIAGADCGTGGSAIGLYVGNLNKVIVNGTCLSTLLRFGGILGGTGTVGSLTSQAGKVSPGNSAGVLNSGNVSLDSSSSMDVEIGGTTTGSYDQLNVTGTVSLGSATLNVSNINSFIPTLNDTFTIINNDGSDAVTGTFSGLAQGATLVVDTVTYTISYTGGTGNDVVLTATVTPGPPDTSGVLAQPANLVIAGAVIISGIALLIVRQKVISAKRHTARTRAQR